MKKIISILFIFAIFCVSTTVNAQELNISSSDNNIDIEIVGNGSAPEEFFDNPADVLRGQLRSTSKPTVFWNLNSNEYTGNLIEVRRSWLYTNYYFSPSSSGVLFLDYNISPINVNGTKMLIALYNKSTDKFEQTYTTGGVPTAACIRVAGLNTNQHYAFAFKAIRDPDAYHGIKGTIKVYH